MWETEHPVIFKLNISVWVGLSQSCDRIKCLPLVILLPDLHCFFMWIPTSLPGYSICSRFFFFFLWFLLNIFYTVLFSPLGVIKRLKNWHQSYPLLPFGRQFQNYTLFKSFPMNSRILMLKSLVLFHGGLISLLSTGTPQGSFQILTVGTWWNHTARKAHETENTCHRL